eukprot:RCo042748
MVSRSEGPPLGSLELFTTMLAACKRGDIDTLRARRSEFLLNPSNFAKCIDDEGDTLLHKAVRRDLTVMRFCVESLEADLNIKNNLGKTALHVAVKENLPGCVEYLLERRARADEYNNVGSTPLHTAASCGSVDCLNLLLQKGRVDVNAKDSNGNTALHRCAFDGVVRVAAAIVAAGGSVNATNNELQSVLHFATKMNRLDMMKFLVENKADVNAVDNKGLTPIHHAASRCLSGAIQYLVSVGSNINAVAENFDSNTPLHVAAQNFKMDSKEWEDLIQDMLRLDASPTARNIYGKLPTDFVNRNVHYLFDPAELKKVEDKRIQRLHEETKAEQELEARRVADLAERKRQLEERERQAREEAERRQRELEEWRQREEEAKQKLLEEEERKRLEEEEARKKKKRRPKPEKK